jgi:hypothetical protein
MTASDFNTEIENLRLAGAPEKQLTPLIRLHETMFDGECSRAACDVFSQVEQTNPEDYRKAVNEAVKSLPKEVQDNSDFKQTLETLTLAGQRQYEKQLSVEVSRSRNTYFSGDLGLTTSISDRKELLAMLREKYPAHYTFEQYQSDLAKLDQIAKQGDEAMLDEAVAMLQDVAPNESFKGTKVSITDLTTAFKASDPLSRGTGLLGKAYSGAAEVDIRNTWAEYYRAQDAWLDACRENPSWTKHERADLFYKEVVSPTFERLSRAKLHQTPEQYRAGIGKSIQLLQLLKERGSEALQKDVPYSSASAQGGAARYVWGEKPIPSAD